MKSYHTLARRERHSRSAFTLIELLTVIAVIFTLAALLFPVFAQVREKARQVVCLNNQKQIGLAFAQYMSDYDSIYPMSKRETNLNSFSGEHGWADEIYPYAKSGVVGKDSTGNPIAEASDGVYACPDYPVAGANYEYHVRFDLCPQGQPAGVTPGVVDAEGAATNVVAESRVSQPASMIFMIEGGANPTRVNDNSPAYDVREFFWTSGIAPGTGTVNADGSLTGNPQMINHLDLGAEGHLGNCDDPTGAATSTQDTDYPGCILMPRYRHAGVTNVLYCDGHVKGVVFGRLNWFTDVYNPATMSLAY